MHAPPQAESLAVGEAPEELRNILRQRSRWCKGHMQVCGTGWLCCCTRAHSGAH